MRANKRKANDRVDSVIDKTRKNPRTNSSGPELDDDPASKATPSANPFQVEIKLPSSSKAERNDPKPKDWFPKQLDLSVTEATENDGSRNMLEPAGIAGRAASQPALTDRTNVSNEQVKEDDGSELNSEEENHYDGSEGDPDDSEFDEFAEFEWLEAMNGRVICSNPPADGSPQNIVAVCHGKLIRRGRIRATFYHQMEEPSRDTSMLAFELFDRYGRLKSEVKDHPVKKGSGAWGEELDSGDILLIEYLRVKKEYRRKGLGSKLVGSMVDKARDKSTQLFAIAWPAFLTREVEADIQGLTDSESKEQVYSRAEDASASFFRSIGFRRIGSTRWFGLAGEANHPSHLIAPENDYDPAESSKTSENEVHPLHQSLMQSSDEECLTALSEHLRSNPETSLDWLSLDAQGNTLLHLAGLNSKAASVEWIMKHEFGSKMLDKRNHEGYLPLEAVVHQLELMRTRIVLGTMGDRTIPLSDKFEGHSAAAVRILVALKGLTMITDLDRARLALGCTCGQCTSGFLSPRMCFALLCQAEIQQDMLSDSVGLENGPNWVFFNKDLLQYLPSRVRDNLLTNKSMRQGFGNLCGHIATCLRAKQVPNVPNVLDALDEASEWPPVTKNFLQRGGSIESVALMIIELAMDQDELAGDGWHEEVFSDDIEKLRACRNDHEFGFVSGMCGYKRISQMRYVSIMGVPIDSP